MSALTKLKALGCRTDGLNFNADGTVTFVATNVGGAWTDAQKNAVLAALGLAALVLNSTQLQAHYGAVIQAWLDQTAQSFGYNNLAYAVSYSGSSVALWAKQGAAFASWRDQVWQAAFNLLSQVESGQAQPPASDAALIAELPQPTIPTS
ncbi:MAG: hypothetical protein ACREEN_00655 [Stellaceae bacterium]